MNDEIMVSVLCVAYNHGKYIRQTLESFLAQDTNFSYEILVNDDASTDDTAELIRQIAEKNPDKVFPILQSENQYSKGKIIVDILMQKARGKYVAICEGDDYWSDTHKLQTQVDWMESHPDYSACVHNTMIYNCENGEETPYNIKYSQDRDLGLEDVAYGVGRLYHTSSILSRAEYYLDMPEFYYISMKHHVGDHPRAIWFAINGKVRYMDRIMSVYRCYSAPSSWSVRMRDGNFVEDRLTGAVEMYKSVLKHVKDADAIVVEDALLKYEWELLQAKAEFGKMKKAPYDKLYKAAPLKNRLWINFKQYFPGLYCAYMKLSGREELIPERMRKSR